MSALRRNLYADKKIGAMKAGLLSFPNVRTVPTQGICFLVGPPSAYLYGHRFGTYILRLLVRWQSLNALASDNAANQSWSRILSPERVEVSPCTITCHVPGRQLTIIAGLGRALVEALLLQPSHTIIAGVRDPRSPISLSLAEFPRAADTELITIKIDSTSDSDASDAAQVLTSEHGVEKLDIVIANAGFGETYGDLATVKPEEVSRLVDVNGIGKQDMFTGTLRHCAVGTSASCVVHADFNSGPLRLFQGVRKHLENSPTGKFVLLGSPIASIGGMEKAPWPMFAYGASKTVAHYLTRKIHYESPGVTAFVIDPG